MREILFKGKTKDGKRVEGFLFNSQLCRIFWATAFEKEEDNMFYCEGEDVNPETVGQFIGLYDKDHTPIFSNSKVAIIVDNKQQSIEKVVYVVEKASFMLEATLGNGKKIYHPLPLPNKDLVIKEIKVIGE